VEAVVTAESGPAEAALTVLGIDPGAELGGVLLRATYRVTQVPHLYGTDASPAVDREQLLWHTTVQRGALPLWAFLSQVVAILDKRGGAVPAQRLDVVACEQAHLARFRGRRGASIGAVPYAVLNQIIGAVMVAAGRWRADFRLVPPAAWRQTLTGAGNPSPQRIRLAAKAQFAETEAMNEHEVAALGVAVHVARTVVTLGRWTKAEAEGR
jgi:Holliday junction resolvasome RuvABC endonuclease subunit